VVAVVGVRFTWLAEIAFNVIIAYSSLVAIHLFSLLATYDFDKAYDSIDDVARPLPEGLDSAKGFGDVDLLGLAPLLWVSVIMLVPMLAWSSTLRSYNARLVIQAWALLIFIAFALTFGLWYSYTIAWSEDLLMTVAFCKNIEGCEADGYDPVLSTPMYVSKATYEKCKCTDLCSLLSPTAPMRFGTGMVTRLTPEYVSNLVYSDAKLAQFTALQTASYILGISALVQGSLALLSSNTSQESVRNRIFKIVYGDLYSMTGFMFKGSRKEAVRKKFNIRPSRKTSRRWKVRRHVARTLAAVYYLLECLSLVLYPVAFVMAIYVNEVWLMTLPYSEFSDSVGSWGFLAGVGLALVTYWILLIEPYITRGVSTLLLWLQYEARDRPEDTTRESKADGHHVALKDRIHHLAVRVRLCTVWPVVRRWKEFRLWWKDPETFSYPETIPPGEIEIVAPLCGCSECLHDMLAPVQTGKLSEYAPSKSSNTWSEYAETLLSQESSEMTRILRCDSEVAPLHF
jgi:hypothetical protein